MVSNLVKIDAQNRAVRTFFVALGVDVALAVALLFGTTFQNADGWGDLQWITLSFLLVKTVVTSAVSYVLRLKLAPTSPRPESDNTAPSL